MGRASVYTEDLADTILQRLAEGESLRQICETDGFPHRTNVLKWLETREDFATRYARARESQGDAMDDRILQVAAKCEAGELDPHAAKVVIGALQWRASKLRPKVYGDKLQQEVSGAGGEALKIIVTGIRPTEDNT